MNYNTFIHQFEVRYTPILDFSDQIKSIITPFTHLANRFRISNDNTINFRIDLYFESDFYQISILWDRIFIIAEQDLDSLAEKNSVVEEPFFNILSQIKKISTFGSIANFIYLAIVVENGKFKSKNKDELVNEMRDSYFKSILSPISANCKDFVINFKSSFENEEIEYSIGPFVGESDFNTRGFEIKNPSNREKLDSIGEFFSIKIFNKGRYVSFKKYQELAKQVKNTIYELWK